MIIILSEYCEICSGISYCSTIAEMNNLNLCRKKMTKELNIIFDTDIDNKCELYDPPLTILAR